MTDYQNRSSVPFTQVPNELIADTNLTDSSFRLLVYLLSKPSGWAMKQADVCKRLGWGESRFKSARSKLQSLGYVRHHRKSSGKTVWEYENSPQTAWLSPQFENQLEGQKAPGQKAPSGKPSGGFSPCISNTEKDSNTKKDNNTDKHLGGEEGFEEFWDAYPRGHRVDKKGCRAKWKARKLAGRASEILADVGHRIEADGNWMRGFIPQTTTYLNQSRWESDLAPVRQDKNEKRNPWDHAREVLENY